MDSPFLTRAIPQMPILPHNTFLYSSFPAELCTYRLSTVSKLTQKCKIMNFFLQEKCYAASTVFITFGFYCIESGLYLYPLLLTALWLWVRLNLLTETSTTEVPGSKGSQCVGLTTLPTFMCWLSRNSGSLTQPPKALRAYPGLYRNSCTFTFMFHAVFDIAAILIMCSTSKGSAQQKLHTNNQLTVNTKNM